ncbi:MAG TPA: ParA family protein [Planctomycetota bacterium]|nr:ParA family protein [Planctomycetota bacterium]
MRVLSLVNQKGGCGKTTAAIHLGAALARKGARVLVVDLDPQGHATLGLGCESESGPNLADVLSSGVCARLALREAPAGLVLMPASAHLAEFEEAAAVSLGVEGRLRRALASLALDFEYALLDCPPRADGVLTANALAASSVALLVVETGAFALQGALRALALLGETARAQEARFDVRVMATLFDRRTRFEREVLVALQARFGALMFDTAVRRDVRLREAVACGLPVQELSPRSRGARDFAALADEVAALRLSDGRELEAEPERATASARTTESAPLARDPYPALRPGRIEPLRTVF